MPSAASHQVVIVGGGPVGLINALGLARQGVDVIVLERHADVVPEPRAMTYHWAVLDGLAELGILEDMEAEGFRLHEMCYRVFRTGEVIRLGIDAVRHLTPYPYAVVLGQDQISRIVLQHLAAFPNASVQWSTEVISVEQDGNGATIRARASGQEIEIHADWVIGADGARSLVRKASEADFVGFTWPEQFVATNVRYDLGAHGWDDCNYLVDPEFGAVIAKVTSDGLWRVTFAEPADSPMGSIEERIEDFYRTVLPGTGPYNKTLHSVYRMHQRVASSMRTGRLLLAGDAAHATNPTNGFGLVSGMMDSLVLADALGAVIAGTAPQSVLDHYSDDRRRVFNEVATPSSSETKRLVFHSTDPERLESDLTRLRSLAADPEMRVNQLMVGHGLLTPSLVPVP
ncbi:pentachlorophenol monooxygenase [Citricoccus zhacaiensis]|uniref:Pentachlorophenol monooxygenase n=1 Tax=Citricoccus zhacaiensis TaxID=489142 RepID=A0ABQ2MCQ3_9MICC|nr:FAD-dependent monooxygenase [Citricoccus zhacaiensis]GGO48678.1 pentachlorophenol monooxygenase [Citricoccus zhacaiensis]